MTTARVLAVAPQDSPMGGHRLAASENLGRNERLVLDELMQADGPMKAYEILQPLTGKGIRAPMTVYRALDRLTTKGLVKRVATLNAFQFVAQREEGRCTAFLICRHCQSAEAVAISCDRLGQLFGRQGIDDGDASIELQVECAGCSRQKGRIP